MPARFTKLPKGKGETQLGYRTGYGKYFLAVFGTMFVMAATIFSVNFLVDPLWYSDGNKFSEFNFVYNERFSKTNLFLQNPEKYNCVIFGSSRSTLLNEKKVKQYKCFNYSMAAGNIREYLSYANFIEDVGGPIELVIIGVDNFSFVDAELADRAPEFVRSGGRPPHLIWAYMDVEVFLFSLRSLVGWTDVPRYYGTDFTVSVFPDTATYRPPSKLSPGFFAARFRHPRNGKYSTRNLSVFKSLREKFPRARVVGYVPPITADFIQYLYNTQNLDNYLDVLYQASKIFDVFFDFSIPSYVTADRTKTYDGGHYFPEINDQIVEALNGGAVDFGLAVHCISWTEYRDAFYNAIRGYVASTGEQFADDGSKVYEAKDAGGEC